MVAGLRLGEGFELPAAVITLTQAILAKKGSGKTYTATVFAEELLKLGTPVVIADPTGAWWGLKSSASGEEKGYPVVVFGGEHADVPLAADAGEIVALSLIEGRYSAVLDLSLFRKAEMNRFMAAFLETLYRKNRASMHLIVDEADTVAPQKPFGDEARTLGAMQDVVRRGRIRGIGVTMITQRPQVLNKDVLTQADVLVALRLSHPKDLAAIKEWVDVHADAKVAKEMLDSLPSLPIGTGWFWAPSFDILQRVAVRKRETFDSSRTPQPGEKITAPKVLAHIDLQKLGKQIEATMEQAKANSVPALKAEVDRLKALVSTQQTAAVDAVDLSRFQREIEEIRPRLAVLERDLEASLSVRNKLIDFLEQLTQTAATLLQEARVAVVRREPIPLPAAVQISEAPRAAKPMPHPVTPAPGMGTAMAKAERSILTVLAQRGPSPKSTVAAWAGYSVGGGGFNNSLSACRTKDWLAGSDPLTITAEGRAALGSYTLLPTGRALLEMWCGKVGKAEREILSCLSRHRRLSKEKLAELCSYTPTGGGFNNALSSLRTLELVVGSRDLELTPDFAAAVRGA